VFGDTAVDVGTVVSAARSAGMFAPRRVVLVRDVEALEGAPEPLVEFAAHPPAQAHILVRAPKLDGRRKLHQALGRAPLFFEFGPPTQVAAELQALAAQKGVRLEEQALSLLAQVCGSDLYRADAELEKLRVWRAKDAGPVSVDDLRETACGSPLLSGWEVADAVLARDWPGTLAAWRRAAAEGEEGYLLVGGLASRARTMLQAKAGLAYRSGPRSGEEYARGVERYTLRELLGLPRTLMHADRDLKSRSMPKTLVVEQALESIVEGEGR
jgi:DNA polymerase III delta subunit